jgi:hypothetical protein
MNSKWRAFNCRNRVAFANCFSVNCRAARQLCTCSQDAASPPKKPPEPVVQKLRSATKSQKAKVSQFFRRNPHLVAARPHIPEKYFVTKRITPPENLYLIDANVAKKAARYVLPHVKNVKDHIVSETNAGLGLITSELLSNGIKLVRLYESCLDFKAHLRERFKRYKGCVELFTKDIFLLHRYEYIDKQDHGNRVEQLLKDVPKKSWSDDPALTIIGPLPNMNFIRFLLKSLVLQTFVVSFGRIQLFAFMKPRDYIVFTAGPHLNLHTYQRWSVLFNLFFECELLDKFPREIFLPWQSQKSAHQSRYVSRPKKNNSNRLIFRLQGRPARSTRI